MSAAIMQANSSPDPEFAVRHGLTPKQVLLVKVCRELQREVGDKSFFMSARTAADIVDVHWTTAAPWLRALTAIGVLKLVKKGSRKGNLASEWRYLPPMA